MMNLSLVLAALVSTGFVGALIARRIGVPMITGYLVIGMPLSPSVSLLLPKELLAAAAAIITPLALGLALVNRLWDSEEPFSVVYDLEELLYALLFTIVGTKLDLSLFASGGLLAKAGVTVGLALLVEQDPRMAGVVLMLVLYSGLFGDCQAHELDALLDSMIINSERHQRLLLAVVRMVKV